MSLIKCPECGKEVSDKSKTCVHCGYPLARNNTTQNKKGEPVVRSINKHLSLLLVGLAIIVFVIVIFICGMNGSKHIAPIKGHWECVNCQGEWRYADSNKEINGHSVLNVSSDGTFVFIADGGSEYKGKFVFQEIKHDVILRVDGEETKPDVYIYSIKGDEFIAYNKGEEELRISYYGRNIQFEIREKGNQTITAILQFKQVMD